MQDIGLLNAIGAKIDYLSRRQEVISQNVANADTPGYRPQDLTKVDFGSFLGRHATGGDTLRLRATQSNHMGPEGSTPGQAKDRPQKSTYEVAPAGNAVILEEQLVQANTNKMDYDLMINLYNRNLQLLRTAVGAQR
jgi:flagellar basal-body rod protein FlgB